MTDAMLAHSSSSDSQSEDRSCLTGTNGCACLDVLSLVLAFVAAAAADLDPGRPVTMDLDPEAVHFMHRETWVEWDNKV